MFTLRRAFTSAAALLAVAAGQVVRAPTPDRHPALLTHGEAYLLAYLSPFAQEVRRAGYALNVGHWDGDTPESIPPFFVVDVIRVPPGPVEIHQYIVVNLATAQVWELASGTQVNSSLLDGAEAIMRAAHGIGGALVRKFQNVPPPLKPCRGCGA